MMDKQPIDLDKIVYEMRTLGDFLVDFSFPKVPGEDEDQISLLKSRDVTVDGYDVVVHFGKSAKDDAFLECFQCLGQRSPFLPFSVVSKLAKRFLGDKHLCFVDVFIDNKKVYCWTLNTDQRGRPLPTQQEVLHEMEFEGLKFGYLNPANVNFF